MAVIIDQQTVNPLLFLAGQLNQKSRERIADKSLSLRQLEVKARELSQSKILEQRRYETELNQLNSMRQEKAKAMESLRLMGGSSLSTGAANVIGNTERKIADEYADISNRMTYFGEQAEKLGGEITQLNTAADMFTDYRTKAAGYFNKFVKGEKSDIVGRGVMSEKEVDMALEEWQPENRNLAKAAILSIISDARKSGDRRVDQELRQAQVQLGYSQLNAAKGKIQKPDSTPYVDTLRQMTDNINFKIREDSDVANMMADLGLDENLFQIDRATKNPVQFRKGIGNTIMKLADEHGDSIGGEYEKILAQWRSVDYKDKPKYEAMMANQLLNNRGAVEDFDFPGWKLFGNEKKNREFMNNLLDLYGASRDFEVFALTGADSKYLNQVLGASSYTGETKKRDKEEPKKVNVKNPFATNPSKFMQDLESLQKEKKKKKPTLNFDVQPQNIWDFVNGQ